MPSVRAWCTPWSSIGRAAEEHATVGRPMHASKNLDQSRLSGAVFAEQYVHFAGPQLEIDFVERKHAGELLGQFLGLQNGRGQT